MVIRYQLFDQENLLIQKIKGHFIVEKYLPYIGYIMRQIVTDDVKSVLIDFRDLQFDTIPEDFDEVMDRMIAIRKNIIEKRIKRNDVNIVFWVVNPLPTVIAHLFKINFSDKRYSFCSTAEQVVHTLNLPGHMMDIETIIMKLERTFPE